MWTYPLTTHTSTNYKKKGIFKNKKIYKQSNFIIHVLILISGVDDLQGAIQSGRPSRASEAQPSQLRLSLVFCCGRRLIPEFSSCHLSENNFPHHVSLWLWLSAPPPPTLLLHQPQLLKGSLVSHTRCKEMCCARKQARAHTEETLGEQKGGGRWIQSAAAWYKYSILCIYIG